QVALVHFGRCVLESADFKLRIAIVWENDAVIQKYILLDMHLQCSCICPVSNIFSISVWFDQIHSDHPSYVNCLCAFKMFFWISPVMATVCGLTAVGVLYDFWFIGIYRASSLLRVILQNGCLMNCGVV